MRACGIEQTGALDYGILGNLGMTNLGRGSTLRKELKDEVSKMVADFYVIHLHSFWRCSRRVRI